MNDPTKAKQFFQDKIDFSCGPVEVNQMWKDDPDRIAIIDVRAEQDYQAGHVPGAVNLPKEKWQTLHGLQKNKTNIVYCYSMVCHLAAKAAAMFAEKGFSVMEMEGGYKSWKQHGHPIEPAKQEQDSSSRMKPQHFQQAPTWDQPESGTRRS